MEDDRLSTHLERGQAVLSALYNCCDGADEQGMLDQLCRGAGFPWECEHCGAANRTENDLCGACGEAAEDLGGHGLGRIYLAPGPHLTEVPPA